MRTILMLMSAITSISLSACSSMSGNVVQEKGPSMEQVYDSMKASDVKQITHQRTARAITPLNTANSTFHKIPNPELHMYVYPHLAGKDEMPVPGYFTEFNAYPQDHYALPNEI